MSVNILAINLSVRIITLESVKISIGLSERIITIESVKISIGLVSCDASGRKEGRLRKEH